MTPVAEETSEQMTLEEAMQELGISRQSLYNAINAGLITPLPKPQPLKKRGRTYFRRDDVLRLKQGKTPDTH